MNHVEFIRLLRILGVAVFSVCTMPCIAEPVLQSAVEPASEQARYISTLWSIMFWVAVSVFVGVMTVLVLGLVTGKRQSNKLLTYNQSRNLVLVAGVAIPFFVIAFLVGGSLFVGQKLTAEPPENALRIRVTGWMWWWQIDYLDESGRVIATTANEMHVPVGRATHLSLESADVIHSFWVPQLQGKTDMIPGRTNHSWFVPSKPGTFRGQCAEFCGTQHALMSFLVIAQPPEQFQKWLKNQMSPAAQADTPAQQKGKQVFMSHGCKDCHTLRGTKANGKRGPDLTHFASRKTLAGVTRDNTRGHLAGWISDPQSLKRAAKMPPTQMNSEALIALVDYLESLN